LDTRSTFGVFFMSKYTERFKLSVIEAYESGQGGFRDIAQRHDVDEATVRKWVAAYREHGTAGVKRKYERYSRAFKLFVLQQMRSEGLSDREAAARFNIRNRSVIGLWKRQYDQGGSEALSPCPTGRPKKMPEQPTTPSATPDDDTRTRQELLEELNYLRMENAYLKKLEALAQAQRQAAQRKKRKSCSS
jgi:transposase